MKKQKSKKSKGDAGLPEAPKMRSGANDDDDSLSRPLLNGDAADRVKGSGGSPAPIPPSVSLGPTRLELGLDLGGSLTKVCFFEPYDVPENGRKLTEFIAQSTTYGGTGVRDTRLSFESKRLGGRFHFIYFQTSRTEGAIEIMKTFTNNNSQVPGKQGDFNVHATGGGAIKFAKLVERELGIRLVAEDELETVVSGIVFTLLERPQSCYSIEPDQESSEGMIPKQQRIPRTVKLDSLFPLLVVNIGSGVSIIKVDNPNSMRRISGTAVGGGTFYGLCKLLTRCETFEEAMDMADRGDSRRVNMLVSDIYGGSYERVGLPGSITASFFGKAASAVSRTRPASSGSHEDVINARRERLDPWWIKGIRATAPVHVPVSVLCGVIISNAYGLEAGLLLFALAIAATGLVLLALHVRRQRRHYRQALLQAAAKPPEDVVFQDEDIARALVTMVAQNITQIAYLNARIHQTKRIIFTGNFLRHNPIALRTLTTNLRLFSGGEQEALFMEHEGFFGAVGTYLASEHVKEKLQRADGGIRAAAGEVPRKSSFHGPEEGDDVFYLSSPKLGAAKEVSFTEEQKSGKSMIDVMAELRLT